MQSRSRAVRGKEACDEAAARLPVLVRAVALHGVAQPMEVSELPPLHTHREVLNPSLGEGWGEGEEWLGGCVGEVGGETR